MSIRYTLFGIPTNLSEVADYIKRKSVKSEIQVVETEFKDQLVYTAGILLSPRNTFSRRFVFSRATASLNGESDGVLGFDESFSPKSEVRNRALSVRDFLAEKGIECAVVEKVF